MDLDLIRQVNKLRQDVDGLIKPEVNRWVAWVPTVTQGVAITKTVTYANYTVLGNTVIASASLALTSAGTAASAINISVPLTPATGVQLVGSFFFVDTSTSVSYAGALFWVVASTTMFLRTNTVIGNFGNAPGVTIASGDVMNISLTYERA